MVSCCPLGTGSTVYILGLSMSLSPQYFTVRSLGSATFANNPHPVQLRGPVYGCILEKQLQAGCQQRLGTHSEVGRAGLSFTTASGASWPLPLVVTEALSVTQFPWL